MLTDTNGAVAIAAAVLIVLALCRNALRTRVPRWVHIVSGLLLVEIVVGMIYTEYELRRGLADIGAEEAGNKATLLAQHISHAMWGYAIAVLGVILAIVVLVIGAVMSRGRSDDVPAATAR